MLAPARGKLPTPNVHRLQLGLPGYLILFAPLAFVFQRQERPRNLPSLSAFLLISTHFTATPEVPVSSSVLKTGSFDSTFPVEPRAFTIDTPVRLHTLYAQ